MAIEVHNIDGDSWTPITAPGAGGACWLQEVIKHGHVVINHSETLTEFKINKSYFLLNVKRRLQRFGADSGEDIYYAKCSFPGDTAVLIVDSGPGFIGDSVGKVIPESNGAWPVNIQDQTTEPIDSFFSQSISNFTLAADTGVSGIPAASLIYSFEAAPGHGIVAGNEILLLDVVADHALSAEVISVDVDTIEIDRPIDNAFPFATSLGRIVNTNMVVDGSVTPQIFSIRAGSIPVDSVRFIITMRGTANMGEDTFGGLNPLQRGFVFRIVNGFQKTIFNFKINQDIRQFCFDADYPDKVPSGQHSFLARITFGGQAKHGIVLRISGTDVLQWVVQDDLTGGGLEALRVSDMGHVTGD